MKININAYKDDIVKFIFSYLSETLSGRQVDLIYNGEKNNGKVSSINYKYEKNSICIILKKEKETKEFDIPILEETLARIGKSFFYFQTQKHITVIECTD